MTGLSVGMGVSWICLISAEMISGQFGVGYFTWLAYGVVKYSQIVVGMLVIGVLGMLSSWPSYGSSAGDLYAVGAPSGKRRNLSHVCERQAFRPH